MLVVKMDVGLHAFGHSGSNEPLDCCLLLGSDPLSLPIMSLPFGGKEIRKTTQPLMFLLNLSLPFAKATQPINIRGHPGVPYSFYSLRDHIVHLEAFPE